MIKKQTMKYLAGMGLLLWMQIAQTTVYAGTINANEQRIINYYSKTFYYKGKAYVATESAKQAAYNKLTSDAVDLTSKEADSYILQLSANVKQGIEEGYLVELQSGGSSSGGGSSSQPDSGNSNSGSGDTETPGKPDSGNDETGTSTKPDMGDTDTGNNTGTASQPDSGNTDTGDDTGTASKPEMGGDGTNNSNQEEVPPGFVGPFPITPPQQGDEGEAANKDDTEFANPQPSAGGNQSVPGDDDGWSDLSGGQTTGFTGEVALQGSGSGEDTLSPEGNGSSEEVTIDLQNLIEKAKQNSKKYVFYDQNNNLIEPEDLQQALQEGPITVKDYTDGKMKIIDDSGTVLFESSIPDKGINLRNGNGWMKWVFLLSGIPLILIVFRLVQRIINN